MYDAIDQLGPVAPPHIYLWILSCKSFLEPISYIAPLFAKLPIDDGEKEEIAAIHPNFEGI
jgi:hypothetical protein